MSKQYSVSGAIARSITHDEGVTVADVDIVAAYEELRKEAYANGDIDDYVEYAGEYGSRVRDVWGTTEDGDTWRVFLVSPETEAYADMSED